MRGVEEDKAKALNAKGAKVLRKVSRRLRAETGEGGGEREELGVGVEWADELQTDAAGEWQRDDGKASERDGCGIAKDSGSGGPTLKREGT